MFRFEKIRGGPSGVPLEMPVEFDQMRRVALMVRSGLRRVGRYYANDAHFRQTVAPHPAGVATRQ
jgi:hypothetical protein